MPKPTRVPRPASANSCYLIEPATFPSLLGTSRDGRPRLLTSPPKLQYSRTLLPQPAGHPPTITREEPHPEDKWSTASIAISGNVAWARLAQGWFLLRSSLPPVVYKA